MLVGQLAGQLRHSHGRAGGGELGGYPQRQRQPGALPGQHRRRVGLDLGAVADQGPQQRHGVLLRQGIQVQAPRTVPGHQSGEGVPAGHQHQA